MAAGRTNDLPAEVWRALDGASTLHRFARKWTSAVDEDIDPHNADALFWAMSYRCQPQHDLHIVPHKHPGQGPRGPHDDGETATVLIDATSKALMRPLRCHGANSWSAPSSRHEHAGRARR